MKGVKGRKLIENSENIGDSHREPIVGESYACFSCFGSLDVLSGHLLFSRSNRLNVGE